MREISCNFHVQKLDSLAVANPEKIDRTNPFEYFLYVDLSSVDCGHIDWSVVETYQYHLAPGRAQRVVREGDVLFGNVRPYLRSHGYVDGQGHWCVASTGFTALRAKPGNSARFLYHLAMSDLVAAESRRYQLGSNYPAVSEPHVESFEVPKPPLAEQRKIAEVLDAVDESIRSTERRIAKLEKSQMGLRDDMFSRIRENLNGEMRHIEDFAAVRRGASPRPIDDPYWFSQDGPGWVRIEDVTASGRFLEETSQKMSAAGAKRSVQALPGQVIMSIAATIGESIVVNMDARIHDGFVLIRNDPSRVDSSYLALALNHYRSSFIRKGQPGTQTNINSDIVRSVSIPLPSVQEQRNTVAIVDASEDRLANAKSELAKLRELKRGLMEDLLTGRVRVSAGEVAEDL